MKASEIAGYIESVIPLDLQEDYDNSGLIIAEPDMEIRSVLITLDVTEEIVEEAIMKQCNMIISHHPLMFRGVRKLTGHDSEQRVIAGMIRERIALYSLHTNLDNSFEGLNRLLCIKLGIINCRILTPLRDKLSKLVTFCPNDHAERVRMALFDAGAGHIGNYDSCSYNIRGLGSFRASGDANPFVGEINQLHFEEETRIEVIFPNYLGNKLVEALKNHHPYEEVAYDIYPLGNSYLKAGAGMIGNLEHEAELKDMLGKIKEITGVPVVRYSGNLHKRVKSIALCTGSGAFMIDAAMRENADLFITSDLKYHDFFKPSSGMALADTGHYESEQFARELIYSFLNEKFPNFALFISETNTNPVNYY